jgi:hypothetical protein
MGAFKMMRNGRKMIFVMVGMISIMGTSFASAATAEPVFGIPVLIPNNPTKLSRINFSVDVSGDDITFVRINVEECNGKTGVCYPFQNISMNKISDITYAQDVTLKHSDATYISYWVVVQFGSLWKDSAKTKLNLSIQQPDGNQTNGSGDHKKSPGFELPVVVIAVAVSLILIGRKRYR